MTEENRLRIPESLPHVEKDITDRELTLAASFERELAEVRQQLAEIVRINNHSLDSHKTALSLLNQAIADCKDFINQVDREGLGMKTITDHRKRVEKFLKSVEQIGKN